MVGDNGGFGTVALHGDKDVAAVGAHARLSAAALAAEAQRTWELQLDILQLDIVHAANRQTDIPATEEY